MEIRNLLMLLGIISCATSKPVAQNKVEISSKIHQKKMHNVERMPDPDGNLNMYMLPTGQGDSQIIQCPDGTLSIIDMGRGFSENDPKFWQPVEIRDFLSGKLDSVRNILVTHNHWDHYILLADTFILSTDLSNVQNFYITCEFHHMHEVLQDWTNMMGFQDRLRLFNGGLECGPNGVPCGNLDICPNNQEIVAKVLAANLGQNCIDGNKNMDSILFKLTWGSVSVLMTGDFEDETTNWEENGPQRQVVNFYGSEMESTVYKISHHGASRLANKPFFRDAIKPKAIFATANPWYSNYRHPRCFITEGFEDSLCRPAVTDSSEPDYCGLPIEPSIPISERVQSIYTCGGSQSDDINTVIDNDRAIYTTTPDFFTINFLTFKTNGNAWGFQNYISGPGEPEA